MGQVLALLMPFWERCGSGIMDAWAAAMAFDKAIGPIYWHADQTEKGARLH